jgi:hypothetical protein
MAFMYSLGPDGICSDLLSKQGPCAQLFSCAFILGPCTKLCHVVLQAQLLAERVHELEAQLAKAEATNAGQERAVLIERERVQPYFGVGLHHLSLGDLETLQQFHFNSLKRLQALLVRTPHPLTRLLRGG